MAWFVGLGTSVLNWLRVLLAGIRPSLIALVFMVWVKLIKFVVGQIRFDALTVVNSRVWVSVRLTRLTRHGTLLNYMTLGCACGCL